MVPCSCGRINGIRVCVDYLIQDRTSRCKDCFPRPLRSLAYIRKPPLFVRHIHSSTHCLRYPRSTSISKMDRSNCLPQPRPNRQYCEGDDLGPGLKCPINPNDCNKSYGTGTFEDPWVSRHKHAGGRELFTTCCLTRYSDILEWPENCAESRFH